MRKMPRWLNVRKLENSPSHEASPRVGAIALDPKACALMPTSPELHRVLPWLGPGRNQRC